MYRIKDFFSLYIGNIFSKDKYILLILLIAGLTGQLYQYVISPNYQVVKSDGVGYTYYLQSAFIYQNLTGANPINPEGEHIDKNALASYGIINYENSGNYLDKYAIGVAISQIPFFLTAHVLAPVLGQPSDGYSRIYQILFGFGGLFYALLGCWFLLKFLRRYFTKKIAGITILSVFLGTNLFYYATRDAIYSNALSFCAISVFMFLIPRWYEKTNIRNSILLGLIYGLVLIARQANGIVILLWLLYGIRESMRKPDNTSIKGLLSSLLTSIYKKVAFFWSKRIYILTFGLSVIVGFFPQWGYWMAVTSNPIIYSYTNEGFNFLNPKIIQILFFPSRNMFYWFPVNLLGFGGLYILWRKKKWFSNNTFKKYNLEAKLMEARCWNWAIVIVLILQIYLVSTWWIWTFGGGFGHRALLDFMPLWSMPIAWAITYLYYGKYRRKLIVFLTLSIIFTLIITVLAWYGINIPDLFEAKLRPIITNVIKGVIWK